MSIMYLEDQTGKNSEEYGLKVYLCHAHHSHKEFMEIFGRNYLDPVEIRENSEKENEPV